MTSSWNTSDDALLEELGASLRDEPLDTHVAGERTAMLMAGYDLVMTDLPIAELVFDSLISPTDPVRTSERDGALPRFLQFEGAGFRIDIEVDGDTVVGHVQPQPKRIQIALDTISGSSLTDPDRELGSFEFALLAGKSFRLRLVINGDEELSTPWIDNDGAKPEP